MRQALCGINNNRTALLVDPFDKIFNIQQLAPVNIGNAIYDNECFRKIIGININRTILFALHNFALNFVLFRKGHRRKERRVMFDVGGHDFLKQARLKLAKQQVNAISRIERK